MLIGVPTTWSGSVDAVPMLECWPNGHESSVPTDYYYADMDGDWDRDGDGFYGEYGDDDDSWLGEAGVDFGPELMVGRIPVYDSRYYSNVYSDLDMIIDKLIMFNDANNNIILPMAISNYEWEENDDGDPLFKTNGLDIPKYVVENIAQPNDWSYGALYEADGIDPVPTTAPYYTQSINYNNFVSSVNTNDPGVVFWWAHGSPTSAARKIADVYGENDSNMDWLSFFSSGNIKSLNNDEDTFFFQCSCQNGYPENINNLGYSLLKKGAISTVSASRNSIYKSGTWTPGTSTCSNADIGYYYVDNLINNNMPSGEALYTAKNLLSSSSENWWQNKMVFNLYGDPSMGLDEVDLSPDSYEADNWNRVAKVISLDGTPQQHNFHFPGDSDWLMFTAFQGTKYIIEIDDIGVNSYSQLNLLSYGENVITYYILDSDDSILEWTCPESGTYYINVTNQLSENYGTNTEYEISVTSFVPESDIHVTPNQWNFGTIEQGTAPSQTFTIENQGTASLEISSINAPTEISISGVSCPFELGVGESEQFTAILDTTFLIGTVSEEIEILSNDPENQITIIPISGSINRDPESPHQNLIVSTGKKFFPQIQILIIILI